MSRQIRVVVGMFACAVWVQQGASKAHAERTQLYLQPIPGLTTVARPAREFATMPLGSVIRFKCMLPPNQNPIMDNDTVVVWTGALEVERTATYSIGECALTALGLQQMTVALLDADGTRRGSTCLIDVIDVAAEDIRVAAVTPSVELVALDGTATNAETMKYFYGPSIAGLARSTRQSAGLDGGRRRITTPRYRTSIDRQIAFQVQTHPTGFEPLMEFSVDGGRMRSGGSIVHSFSDPGIHTIEVGPLGRKRKIEVTTCRVEIVSHESNNSEFFLSDGEVATFEAITDPPGFEDDITWLASTKFGTSDPVMGYGSTFTVRFDNTWGAEGDGGDFQWLGVKADNTMFNQDQKPVSILPCCTNDGYCFLATEADCATASDYWVRDAVACDAQLCESLTQDNKRCKYEMRALQHPVGCTCPCPVLTGGLPTTWCGHACNTIADCSDFSVAVPCSTSTGKCVEYWKAIDCVANCVGTCP